MTILTRRLPASRQAPSADILHDFGSIFRLIDVEYSDLLHRTRLLSHRTQVRVLINHRRTWLAFLRVANVDVYRGSLDIGGGLRPPEMKARVERFEMRS